MTTFLWTLAGVEIVCLIAVLLLLRYDSVEFPYNEDL